jgi:hypothetical protein
MAAGTQRICLHLNLLFIAFFDLTERPMAVETVLKSERLMHLHHLRVLAVALVAGMGILWNCRDQQTDYT